jgi:hypothetical protein
MDKVSMESLDPSYIVPDRFFKNEEPKSDSGFSIKREIRGDDVIGGLGDAFQIWE